MHNLDGVEAPKTYAHHNSNMSYYQRVREILKQRKTDLILK